MKYSLIVSIFALSLTTAPVFANEAHYPPDSATEQSASSAAVQPSGGMGMMQMHGEMHQHMDKMYAIMEKARQAKSDTERRKLMHEHSQEMHKAMGMMGGNGNDMTAMPMEKRMDRVEAGMGMMKKMMQHMMDQQSMMMDMKSDTEGR